MINKLFIFLYVLILQFLRRIKRTGGKKTVLFVVGYRAVGDLTLMLDVLHNLSILREKCKEWDIHIALDANAHNLIKEYGCYLGDDVIDLNLRDKPFHLNVYRYNISKLGKCYWDYILVPSYIHDYLNMFIAGIAHGKVVAADIQVEHSKTCLSSKFFDLFISKENYPVMNGQEKEALPHLTIIAYSMFEYLLNNVICLDNYEYKHFFPQIDSEYSKVYGRYVVVCASIGEANFFPGRVWPLKNFATIIKQLIGYGYKIVLVGVDSDKRYHNNLWELLHGDQNIIDLTGKTPIEEWLKIVKGARLVLTNDSGLVHVAALLGVDSLVISGYWNYGLYLPYDRRMEGYKIPCDIRSDAPECKICLGMGHKQSELDKKCEYMRRKKGICMCINNVTVEMVLEKIKVALSKTPNFHEKIM